MLMLMVRGQDKLFHWEAKAQRFLTSGGLHFRGQIRPLRLQLDAFCHGKRQATLFFLSKLARDPVGDLF